MLSQIDESDPFCQGESSSFSYYLRRPNVVQLSTGWWSYSKGLKINKGTYIDDVNDDYAGDEDGDDDVCAHVESS